MRLLAGGVALFVFAAVSLVACGGDEDPATPSEPPAQLLETAAANPVTSGQADIDLEMDLEGDTPLAGRAGFEATGPFDLGDGTGIPAFELEGEGEVAGFGLDTDVISTGDDAFVIFFGENYRVGPDRFAEAEDALASAGGGGGLGVDLANWFEDPAYAGSEEVAGTDTEKIEGTLDAKAAAADLVSLAEAVGAPPFAAALAEGAGSGPVDAWVAYDDQTIRRVRAQFPFTVPPGQLALTRGVESGTVTLDAEISDAGEDVTIGVPEGGGFQPIEDLTSRLQSLASLGGL